MRLLTLDLERYGPFTGKHLAFRSDAKLHIVFGPNEAGKSSSLAAVTDLLFGVKPRSSDDFLRPGKEMRLGAMIRDGRGQELTFIRRKLKPLLSDAAGTPLADDALSPFLGGISRDVFRRAFGLDAETLRESAEELKKSDGELGAALFSAASGLRGISDIKGILEREADGIFATRASKDRAFYQALERFEAARKALREHETRAGGLKALQDGLDEQEIRGKAIAERRTAISLQRGTLERLRRAAPIRSGVGKGPSCANVSIRSARVAISFCAPSLACSKARMRSSMSPKRLANAASVSRDGRGFSASAERSSTGGFNRAAA